MLGLTGCVPDYRKETAAYRSVLGDNPESPPFDPASPLSLADALRLARNHNEQLAIKGEQYLQALIDKDRAVAAFLPTVSFAPNYLLQPETHIGGGALGPGPLISQFVPPHALDLPFRAGMSFNLVGDAANIKRASLTAQQQRDLLADLKATVLLDVAQTYYQIIRSQRQVEVLKETVKVQEARVADIEVKHKAGVARPLDVAQLKAQRAGIAVTLIRAQNDVRTGRAVLAFLMGVPAAEGPLADELQIPPEVPDLQRLLATARQNRRDLQAAAAQVQAASSNLLAAWGRYFPSVSADVTYFSQRRTFPQDILWTSMFGVSVPIFSGGLIYADVRTAASQLRQAELARTMLERQMLKEVRVARENLLASARQIEQLQAQVDAADDAMRQAEEELKVGLATNLDRLIAQDQLLAAQLNLISEQLACKVYYLNLQRVVGRLDTDLSGPSPASAPASTQRAHVGGPERGGLP